MIWVSGEVAMADFKTSAKTFTSNHQTKIGLK
jgi:hypothetical protein